MVVASIALAVALSGASYAAVVLPRNSVGPVQLKRNAVTTVKIRGGAVTAGKLARNAVTAGKLAANAVNGAKLADNAVTSPEIADGSVGPADLADAAVTSAKLEDNAVTSAKIADGAVGAADLAPGLVFPTTVVHSTAASSTSSTAYVNLAPAVANVTVPAGVAQVRLLVRFSAESACSGGTGWCSVRILVDGVEAAPAAGTNFAFDSTDAGNETSSSWESHAMERSAVVGPGAHTVQVQWAVTQAATTLRLDDWTLVVDQHITG